jgi:signal peptidase I
VTAQKLRQIMKNEYFKILVTIVAVIVIFFGFWFGSQIVLNTNYPALAVASGSMCTLPGPNCDGWSHPFARTLHLGDLIIIQGVNAKDIYAAPYNESGSSGDIIVFRRGDELIVHRAIAKHVDNDGNISFTTKGDGNSGPDPVTVSQEDIIGRVVMRIPWIGHIALLMHNSSGIYLIILLVVVLIIVEFVVPVFTGKEKEPEPTQDTEKHEPPNQPATEPM